MSPQRFRQDFLNQMGQPDQIIRLLDLLPDVSFFIKDRQGRFVALNRLACEFCGVRSEQEAIGKNDWDLFPPARVPAYLADDQSVLETGQPILNRLEPTPQMEGAPHLIVTNKVALRDSQGRVIGVAGFSRRVTQVQTAGEALRRLAAAVESLHRDYAQALSSTGLASLAGLSVSQFERTFRKLLGTTPRQYLLRVRVTQACRLLAETSRTVATLALECGFYDQAHFTRAFKAQMGVSPSAYREEQRRPQP